MYDTGDFCAMPILADALQDAGCDSDQILDHCRGDTPHVRGCWVVDEVLGHRSQEARVRQLGLADPLTGVGSGRAYAAVVRRSILERVSLLALEIDSFAPFIETHAGVVGDRALAAIAWLLRDALGHRGFLARTADAGFRIVLPNSVPTAVLEVGERLRRMVAGWCWSNEQNDSEHTFTVSVGAATAGEAAVTRNTDSEARRLRAELEADAVRALRRAQACGGNRVCLSKRGE
jgi:diguanylate cyclase (GGDEF)-like protein